MTGPVMGVDHNGHGNPRSTSDGTHGYRALVGMPDQLGRSLPVPDGEPDRDGGDLRDPRDPDLDDPRIAIAQYRALLAELDQARTKVADRVLAGRERRAALARTHRESADAIRSRVDEVWRTVAEPLAHHGISDLDQLRPAPVTEFDHDDVAAVALRKPTDRSAVRATHRRGAGSGRGRSTGTALERTARSGRPAVGADDPVEFDPAAAPARAHELCLTAMGHAAELRAITRAGPTTSAAMIIGLACLLVAGTVTALRVFLGVEALASLAGGALVAGVCVVVLTDASRIEVARAALLGAGTAGAAVLATARVAPLNPPGLIASLVAVVLAVRFGLGIGAPRDPRDPRRT